MNGKIKRTLTVAGAAVSMSAGIFATTLLVNQLAAETPDPTTGEPQQPLHYTGPTTADGADHWFEHRTEYTGPTTPDAAAHWFGPYGPYVHQGPGETYLIWPPPR